MSNIRKNMEYEVLAVNKYLAPIIHEMTDQQLLANMHPDSRRRLFILEDTVIPRPTEDEREVYYEFY